jgi:hypothetical protein
LAAIDAINRQPVVHAGWYEFDEAPRPLRRSWWSGHLATGQWPDFESPFCADAMLVDPDDRAVDDRVFEIQVTG